jgi:hypothetical protein
VNKVINWLKKIVKLCEHNSEHVSNIYRTVLKKKFKIKLNFHNHNFLDMLYVEGCRISQIKKVNIFFSSLRPSHFVCIEIGESKGS